MAGVGGDKPRISVVTPSLNQGEFIDATMRSVVTQGYPELEYVVIDGGSNDGSVDVIKRYQASLAYWVSEPDQGHADALNKGFARTSGEIMCWINSSDMYYPWTFETVAQVFSQLPHVEWIAGSGSTFDPDGLPKSVRPAPDINVYDVLAGDHHWIQQESVFWRRSLWERAGGRLDEGLKCAADFDLWLRFFRLAPLFGVGTLLGGYRVHDDPLSKADNGLYEREGRQIAARFIAEQDRRSLARARIIRWAGTGKRRIGAEALSKLGILPWYSHPRVVFDFDSMAWTIQ